MDVGKEAEGGGGREKNLAENRGPSAGALPPQLLLAPRTPSFKLLPLRLPHPGLYGKYVFLHPLELVEHG